jgi:hypothetical protein
MWPWVSSLLAGLGYGLLADIGLAVLIVVASIGYEQHVKRRARLTQQSSACTLPMLDDIELSDDAKAYSQTIFETSNMLWKRYGTANVRSLQRKPDRKP